MSEQAKDRRRPVVAAARLSHAPSIVDSAAAHANGARRVVQQAAPIAPSALSVDPGDLVTRALAILAEETEAWQARWTAPSPRERSR